MIGLQAEREQMQARIQDLEAAIDEKDKTIRALREELEGVKAQLADALDECVIYRTGLQELKSRADWAGSLGRAAIDDNGREILNSVACSAMFSLYAFGQILSLSIEVLFSRSLIDDSN